MERSIQAPAEKREFVHTTLGDLICALVEAAGEVTDNTREIELLAFHALRNLLNPADDPTA